MKYKKLSIIFVLLLLIVSTQVQMTTSKTIQREETSILLRMYGTYDYKNVASIGEIVTLVPGKSIDVIIPSSKLYDNSLLKGEYEIIDYDLDTVPQSIRSSYHTLTEMEQILTDLNERYPSITSLYSIGTTYEGREILCLEITDNPRIDEQEPGVLYMGVHHAREWPTMEICLTIAENLTEQYSSNQTIKNLVDNRRIWIIPCVNPDGYYFSHDHAIQHEWRKNRNYFPSFGTYGVDINRNYDGSVNGDPFGMWGSLGEASVSHDPNYEIYCGPVASSEAETNAIKEFFINNDISASISFHTYGEYVMWPWSYSDTIEIPESSLISEIGESIAEKISTQDGLDTYTAMQGVELYPTTGDFADWAYGYSHFVLGRPHVTFTIEACQEFHPSEGYLSQICKENYEGALVLLDAVVSIHQNIPRVLPPLINKITPDNNEYTIRWLQQNPEAQAIKYQIDEFKNITITTDNAEIETDHWSFDGFIKTTDRSYSSETSYKPISSNNQISSMTSTKPLPVGYQTKLSFWCWYDIEQQKDMAFVEVSTDKRNFQVLDLFTGSSNGWILKEYTLEDYRDSSIYIRFRYTTNDADLLDGFYIDDISPLPVFSSISTLSDSLTDSSFSFVEKEIGDYYYRVRGYNDVFGWGDYSPLQRILVGIEENVPPTAPTINGETQGRSGKEYSFTFRSDDENEDEIYYYVDWGDGTFEEWIGPYRSGQNVMFNHTWEDKNDFVIQARSKDLYGLESEWTTLEIAMPYSHIKLNILFRFLNEILNYDLFSADSNSGVFGR